MSTPLTLGPEVLEATFNDAFNSGDLSANSVRMSQRLHAGLEAVARRVLVQQRKRILERLEKAIEDFDGYDHSDIVSGTLQIRQLAEELEKEEDLASAEPGEPEKTVTIFGGSVATVDMVRAANDRAERAEAACKVWERRYEAALAFGPANQGAIESTYPLPTTSAGTVESVLRDQGSVIMQLEVTEEMVRAAVVGWFGGTPPDRAGVIHRKMRAALEAALVVMPQGERTTEPRHFPDPCDERDTAYVERTVSDADLEHIALSGSRTERTLARAILERT